MQRSVVQATLVIALIAAVAARMSAWTMFLPLLRGVDEAAPLFDPSIYVDNAIVQAVATVVAGWLVDRIGARRAMVCGVVLTAAGWAVFGFALRWWVALLSVGVVAQAGLSLVIVGGLAHLVRWSPRRRGLMLAAALMGTALCGVVGQAVAAFYVGSFGIRAAAFVLAGLAGVAGALLVAGLRAPPTIAGLADVFGDPEAGDAPGAGGMGGGAIDWGALGAAALLAFSVQLFTLASVARIYAQLGGALTIGVITSVRALLLICGAFVLGALSDRVGRRGVVAGASAAVTVVMLAAAATPSSSVMFAVLSTTLAFGWGAGVALSARMVDVAEPAADAPGRVGLCLGLATMAQSVGDALGGQAGTRFDLGDSLWPAVAASAAAAAVAWLALRPTPAFATAARETTFPP